MILNVGEHEFANFFLKYIQSVEDGLYTNFKADEESYQNAKNEIERLLYVCDSIARCGYPRLLHATVQCAEKVLYNPRSPYSDEELYIPFAQHVLESRYYTEEIKPIYREQLRLASKNRIGEKASDFNVAHVASGGEKRISLYGTNGAVLLFFYDPECTSCLGATKQLISESNFRRLLSDGTLMVVAVSVGDGISLEEKDAPYSNWFYCRDDLGVFADNAIYSIRAVPSFYLFDADKKVLLKDASAERVLSYLGEVGDNF